MSEIDTDAEAGPLPSASALNALLMMKLPPSPTQRDGGAPSKGSAAGATSTAAIDVRAAREHAITRKRDARRTVEDPKDQFQQIRCSKSWKAMAKRVARRRGFKGVSEMIVQLVIDADQGE